MTNPTLLPRVLGATTLDLSSTQGFSLKLADRAFSASGLLASDPYAVETLKSPIDAGTISIVGNEADHWDLRNALSAACDKLGLCIQDEPHSLITYESARISSPSTFIVPARWRCCTNEVQHIPGLLDLKTHFVRVVDQGRPLMNELFGNDISNTLYSIAFGPSERSRRFITAIEYASHSFCHSVELMFHAAQVKKNLKNWRARASEECRADRLATRLVHQSFGEETALAVLASQLLTRITCDYFASSDSAESRAHRTAASITIQEFGLQPNFARRVSVQGRPTFDAESRLRSVLEARIAAVEAPS